jgi:hypothetical protein
MHEHKTTIKFVKRAGMWCKTSWSWDEHNKAWKQTQEWFDSEPNA